MYSPSLKARIRGERKELLWDTQHALALADAQQQLVKHQDEKNGSMKSLTDKWIREELAAKVDLLKVN
jgi:hypothetical protein